MNCKVSQRPRRTIIPLQPKANLRQISRENEGMYKRVAAIMKRGVPKYQHQSSSCNYAIKTSLNDQRVIQQNQKMLVRLLKLKPIVCRKKMRNQWIKNQEYAKRIGKYPYKTNGNKQEEKQHNQTQNMSHKKQTIEQQNNKIKQDIQHFKERQNLWKRNYASLKESQFKKYQEVNPQKRQKLHSQEKQKNNNTLRRLSSLQQKNQYFQIILWSGPLKLEQENITISITRYMNSYDIVAVTPEKQIVLILKQQQGRQLLNSFEYDYSQICDRIKIIDNKLTFLMKNGSFKQFVNKQNKIQKIYSRIQKNQSCKTMFALQNQSKNRQNSLKNERDRHMKNKFSLIEKTNQKHKTLSIDRNQITLKRNWQKIK